MPALNCSLTWPFLRRGHTAEYAKVVIILWSPLTTQPNEGDSSNIPRLPTSTQMAYPGPTSLFMCLLVGICVNSMHVCRLKGVTPRFSCRPGPEQVDAGVGGVVVSPVVPPSREEKGLTVRAGISRMYTNQALALSREPSASCLVPAWTTAVASPCSPSFYLAPPIWAACLPAAARAILPNHKSDHITPHAPASSPSHQKQERSQAPASLVLSAACRAGAWERTGFCSLTSSPLTLHHHCVLPSLFLLL